MQPPATRRKFSSVVDEIYYLYDKLVYWLYQRRDVGAARRFAERLAPMLRSRKMNRIKVNECRALVAEARCDWAGAVKSRRREIAWMTRIRELARTEKPIARRAILRDYSAVDLADRYDLLALALWNAQRHRAALDALAESEDICTLHGVPFDGVEIRAEILAELDDVR